MTRYATLLQQFINCSSTVSDPSFVTSRASFAKAIVAARVHKHFTSLADAQAHLRGKPLQHFVPDAPDGDADKHLAVDGLSFSDDLTFAWAS